MSARRTRTAAVGAAAVSLAGLLVFPAAATAQPDPQPEVEAQAPELLHNITYRARVDGVSRGAAITYKAEGDQILFANPTMVPGRVFEVMTVLPESGIANMRVSIEWPYSANLHCEILVDDQIVAQADQFIAPRLFRPKDDPLYGTIQCGAPLNDPASGAAAAGVPALPGYPGQPAAPPPA